MTMRGLVNYGTPLLLSHKPNTIIRYRLKRLVAFGKMDGNFFPTLNQVDLIFEKNGQPFYWALEFQIGAQKENKYHKKKTCTLTMYHARHATSRQTKSKTAEDGRLNSTIIGKSLPTRISTWRSCSPSWRSRNVIAVNDEMGMTV